MFELFTSTKSSLLPPYSILHLPPHHSYFPTNTHRNVSKTLSPISTSSSKQHPFPALHSTPSNNASVPIIDFEEFVEKDWSFLDESTTQIDHYPKTDRIISAGGVGETSRVMVSIGSLGFVDRLMETCSCNLVLVVHDSLFLLACIKEKYDKVKCWQGEVVCVPEKWGLFDVVFLYFLPALPFELDQVLETLVARCSPGARVVISHPQGGEVLEQQRKRYPDVITSNLPDKLTLQNVATKHNFEVAEFVDEQGFYLAVLKLSGARS